MFCIRYRQVVTAAALVLLAGLFALGGALFSMSSQSKATIDEERLRLAAVYPDAMAKQDVDGFVLNILCTKDTRPLLEGESDSEDVVFRGAAMRNAHLESETGAIVNVTAADDFYTTAKEDILSGAYQYDLYAASASDGLARLLSEGALHDISDSEYIDLSEEKYDAKTMESLALNGKKYLISSDISDARWWSKALVYDMAVESGHSLAVLARDGELTLDTVLSMGELLYTDEDVYPLFFGMGGSFVRTDGEKVKVASLSEFSKCVSSLSPLTKQSGGVYDVFSLQTLYEVRNNSGTGILPLPKAAAEDDYSGYIDLSQAVLLGIPEGSAAKDNTEYTLDRMASLSSEYVAPYFEENFFDDDEIYDIITLNSTCDLSVLFEYGDMGALVAKNMRDDTRLTLEYYNRKELYTKAISIIEKRLCPEK